MKKIVTLVALSIIMTGCVSSGKVSVKREQLEHHRFVLESVNGKTVTGPELSFGEDMTVSGKMCNQFTGEGKLSDGELKVKNLAMTRMMCADPQLNGAGRHPQRALQQGRAGRFNREPINAGDGRNNANV
ncbi:hypothetical protein RB531_4911 [Salmonella enterica subsp. enterica serovar Typhimurium]